MEERQEIQVLLLDQTVVASQQQHQQLVRAEPPDDCLKLVSGGNETLA